ncbi:MAG: CHAT domain-containing protein, partial [Cyanobacteria bacterium J06639_1]
LVLSEAIEDIAAQGRVLNNLGALFANRDQPELAIVFYKESVNISEDIRAGIRPLSRDLQESYAQTIAGTYRRLADLLLVQGRVVEAQQVLELLKIQEIRDYTRNAKAGASQDIDYLIEELRILETYGPLAAFAQKIAACQANNCPELSQLNQQRDDLQKEFLTKVNELEAAIEQRKQKAPTLDPDNLPATAQAIVAARPGTMLIYPLVTEDKLWLLLATQKGVTTARITEVDQSSLRNAVANLGVLLANPDSDLDELQQLSQQLYNWLIAPIENELQTGQIQHLVFALDEAARYIPMGALYDGEQYLVERFTITNIINADSTDVGDRLPEKPTQTPVLGLGVSERIDEFDPLEHVTEEINAIVKESPQDSEGYYPGDQYLNRDFQWNVLTSQLAGRKILHIATHGNFSPVDRDQSFILSGNGERIRAADLSTLINYDLKDIHLVVLSACKTAIGTSSNEEDLGDGAEINSIVSYFLNRDAGAKAALASLWNVNDRSTSELMQRFYAELTKSPDMTKSEAIRRAQLSFIDASDDKSHPYHWAPFVLIGNGL